ncbi:MAG: YcaQ family DNA glycosylase [Anaerolineaceae bacterium]|nr:YcaQ family DNA glycosylase [Anaerolineaceae bacterium]
MTVTEIHSDQLRNIQLAAMGLLTGPEKTATKEDVLAYIRQAKTLQIDTIHVVARSPYLVLWSHLGDYKNEWLDQLLAEHKIFEFWAHMASFSPIEDFAILRGLNLAGERPERDWLSWIKENHQEDVERVRQFIRENGPTRSADFKTDKVLPGFWSNAKVEKHAMEAMFLNMELMIDHREKFQRFYDFRERVLPDWDDTNALSPDEAKRELVLRSVEALGAALPEWIPDYFRFRKNHIRPIVESLVDEGALLPLRVTDWDCGAYMHPAQLPLLNDALTGKLEPTYTTLLSPFDPLAWDRERMRKLFNFDYTIEVYTPVEKRVYGYLNLPILHRGRLIGRLDPKAHRKEKIMEIREFHLEEGVTLGADDFSALREMLWSFTHWHKMKTIQFGENVPEPIAAGLR